MTFLIKVKKAGEMKAAVAAVAGIEGATPTATVELTEGGLVIRVIHPTRNLIAFLKIKSTGLHHYTCNRAPYFLLLNLPDFFSILSTASDDDVLTLSSHDPASSLLFVFENLGRRQSRQVRMPVTETTTSRWTTDETAYQYCICLSSPEFRRKFGLLQQFDHTVKITLTENGAKLSAGLLHLMLRKEECVMQGVGGGERRRKVRVSLQHLESIMKASELASGVWIYNSTAEPPIRPLISCPLGPLGTILFFLPRPFYFFPSSE